MSHRIWMLFSIRYISFRYILPSDRGKPHLHLVKKGELNHLKWIIAIQSNICSHWQSNPISHFNKLYYSIFAIHANTDSISYCSTIRFGRCSYIFHISMHLKLLTTASISYRVQSVKFVIIKLMFVSPFLMILRPWIPYISSSMVSGKRVCVRVFVDGKFHKII